MKRICLILTFASLAFAQLPAETAGSDIIVSTGVNFDFIQHQASSLSSLAVKASSIGGLPTYSVSTFETTFAALKAGNLAGNALSVKTGIMQVVAHPKPNWYLWVMTQAGVVKFTLATLGNLEGAVGASYDVGARATAGKYHIYVTPYIREVSISSLQIKPVVGIQLGSGFSAGN